MKKTNWFMVMFVFCASMFSFAVHTTKPIQTETQARTFCAYNRVFVEFKENNLVWGTIMLDWEGKPIPCKEDDDVEKSPTKFYNKEMI